MAKDQLTQVADINAILNKTGQKLGISATQTTEASGAVKFAVNFDSGSFYNSGFLQENLGFIQKSLKPLDPVVGFLTTRIPFASDYREVVDFVNRDSNPSSISLLDVIGFIGEKADKAVDIRLIDDILSFNRFIGSIPSKGEKIALGEFTIDTSGIFTSNSLSNISLSKPVLPSGFEIPLLTKPGDTIFGILQGQTKPIFDYTAPPLTLNVSRTESIPVVGPLGVALGGTFNIAIQLGFGFDTYGIQQDRKFEDGFYIKDFEDDEVKLEAGLRVGPAITVSAASLDVTLGVKPGIGFNLNDPTPGDRLIRLNEIQNLGFDNIFKKPELKLSADLRADIRIFGSSIAGLGINSPTLSLGEFPPAEIEQVVDKVLGYVEQITSLKNLDPIARLDQLGNWVREQGDKFGDWQREITDPIGNVIQEVWQGGVRILKRTWDITGDFIEDTFDDVGKFIGRLEKIGEKFIKNVFDGVSQVSETIWDGTKTIFNKGGQAIEWVDNKLSSIVADGQKILFNTFGDVVDEGGKVLLKGKDFLKGIASSTSSGIITAGDLLANGANAVGDGIANGANAVGDGIANGVNAVGDAIAGVFSLDGSGGSSGLPTPESKPSLTRPTGSGITYRADGSVLVQTGIGADVLEGTKFGDEIRAGGGNDYISGNGGRDFLYGEGGDDIINGGAGDDIINGGDGNDTLKGGIGDDTLVGAGGNNILFGEAGNDILSSGTGDDILNGGDGNDSLFGGAGADKLFGGTGNDSLKGGDDFDFIFGEAGRDNLFGEAGSDLLNGGENDDFLFGGAGNDILDGDIGNDKLFGQDGNDRLYSSEGDDLLDGGAGQDTARYDKEPGAIVNIDEINSYSNTPYLTDIEGRFSIRAGQAVSNSGDTDILRNLENITGSIYDDVLIGNALENILNGLEGNDLLIGNGGNDTLDGGDGIDTVSYRRTENDLGLGIVVNLADNSGFDGIDGIDTLINIENIIGSRYADKLFGDTNSNTILGGDDIDTISGNDGEDTLFGERGNDKIFGGDGNDTLIGGIGKDILDGGVDNDTASYITATSRVAASLADGNGWVGDATGDQFISIENLIGSDYNDFLVGDFRGNILIGGEGDDTLEGGEGNDTLDGGNGRNVLNAGQGNNTVIALNGDDTVYAGFGDDTISVGDGFNLIYAGSGRNIVTTGNDDDDIYSGDGIDVIRAGDGTNDIYAGEDVNLVITGLNDDTIYGGSSLDIIIAGEGFNRIFASQGNNIISAGNGENRIDAGSGSDVIRTGSGDDTIYASEGDNYIDAGTGFNTLDSGSGSDLFALHSGNGFSNIINFNVDRDILGLVGGLNASNLTLRQVNCGGYFTEVSVTATGDVLAQLQGIHTNTNQINWVTLDNPGSSFRNAALRVFENPFTVNNRPEIISAGITSSTLNTLL
jgi:Ca2+-binding RTX toxin-like protein